MPFYRYSRRCGDSHDGVSDRPTITTFEVKDDAEAVKKAEAIDLAFCKLGGFIVEPKLHRGRLVIVPVPTERFEPEEEIPLPKP